MHKLRLAILGAAAVVALGTTSAMAMHAGGVASDRDARGDPVASAAGEDSNTQSKTEAPETQTGTENAATDASEAARVKACKAADAKEDASEKKPAKGDKAAKAADKKEDKAEHKTFAACVSGKTPTTTK